jgi:hypothetical protein
MKTYETPELTVHGSVEELTLANGFVKGRDLPLGHNDSAFPS